MSRRAAIGRAIADAPARRDLSALHDLASIRATWRMKLPISSRGIAAVDRQARPGEIEMIVLAERDAGRIGQAHASSPGTRSRRPAKAASWRALLGDVLVGAGEMAHQRLDGRGRRARRCGPPRR